MPDHKIILGLVSLVIGLVSYFLYLRDISNGKTKPDSASWFIWGVLAVIAFVAQSNGGGAAGAWITALTAIACMVIAMTGFYHGHRRRIKAIDLLSLLGAALGVGLWWYTDDPLLAIFTVIVIGAIGFVPTFLKVFRKPHEETAMTFGLNASKFAIALFALGSLDMVTWLYPAAMTAMNTSLTLLILLRRTEI